MQDEANLRLFDTRKPIRAGILFSIIPDCVSSTPTCNGVWSRLDRDGGRVAIAVYKCPDIARACRIQVCRGDAPEAIRAARCVSASQCCSSGEQYQNPSSQPSIETVLHSSGIQCRS